MEPDAPPADTEISEETAIWKYMDLPRFVSILSRGGLWFAKATTLHDDPWEGFGKVERLQVPPDTERTAPDGSKYRTAVSAQQLIAHLGQTSADYIERAREHLYVNSWCSGPESMAMWQIYGSLGSGVALQSSVERYRRAAKFDLDATHFTFGRVLYHTSLELASDVQLDFRSRISLPGPDLRRDVLGLGLHKRASYQYEQEWRAVLYQDQREITGVHEIFDLEELIGGVYVGPRAEEFIVEAVRSVMERFQVRKPCRKSDLLCAPPRETAPTG